MATADVKTGLDLGSSTADEESVFYYAQGTPVSYAYFSLNVVMIVMHIGIIILNSLMIEALRRSHKMLSQPSGHCFIMLSAVHIWHGIMMIYTGIYGLANMQDKNECLLRFGFLHTAFILINLINWILTIDRYIRIEWPFWYKRRVQPRTIWIGNLVIAFATLFYCLSPIMFNWYNDKVTRSNFCEYMNVMPRLHMQIIYLIGFAGFPFLASAYGRVLCIANRRRAGLGKVKSRKDRKRNWRGVKITLIICLVYILCWGPPSIFAFILTLDPQYPKATHKYSSWLAGLILIPSLGGIINPCIYTLHREVKAKFLQLFKRGNKHHHELFCSSPALSKRTLTTKCSYNSSDKDHIELSSTPLSPVLNRCEEGKEVEDTHSVTNLSYEPEEHRPEEQDCSRILIAENHISKN